MRIDELLEGLEPLDMANLYPDMEIGSITCDSREVTAGSLFVAIAGSEVDGHDYIDEALAAGATVVVQSRPLEPGAVGSFLRVSNPRGVYAALAAKLAEGTLLEEAVTYAVLAGAAAVAREGAQGSLPTPEDVEKLRSERS